ncbi:MAG: RNA-binding protein [Candidatus Thermoplasmatota archaeon]|jgi:PUA domain protein|nr:RNA-binding protein [Candidatus Thermoplasmatota archaeon]MCL5963089.1 RNA-binding protein [Candidatus Thermoplasmatota archaeon]
MIWKNRIRIREKEIHVIEKKMEEALGINYRFNTLNVERVENTGSFNLILADNKIAVIEKNEQYMLSISQILKHPLNKKFVTVDSGAVSFIVNGADVMGRGVVNCDLDIKTDDIVWINEEVHKKPLAIGIALKDGNEIITKITGKVVATIHYIGDKTWKIESGEL